MIRPILVPALLLLAAAAQAQVPPAARPSSEPPAVVQPTPPPVDAAVKAAVDSLPESDPVRRFYATGNYARAWDKTSQGLLLDKLREAERHALEASNFLPDLSTRDPVQRDIRLSRAALTYAQALASGRIDPESVEAIFTLRRNVVDVAAGLNGALATRSLEAWFDELPPTDKGYAGLSNAYLNYRRIAIGGGWPAFKPGAKISPGDRDPRVPAIAQRLLAEGDLAAPVAGQVYNDTLVGAVKTFQVRHGLPDDGVIGVDTQDELAASAEDRARQIATNLERRRWLARVVPTERIDVNTAASILVYWRDGVPIHGSRVVNGKATSPTPSIEAPFSTVLANPPWNVPAGIAAKEILPKGRAYMAARNMYMVDGRVVQKAGPSSALGAVKFEMQNPYAIYLHDTPSKSAFARYQRHLSHGCVRVENAVDFARLVMNENPESVTAFDEAQADKDTTRVKVGKSIPVRLLYWTAFMTGADRVAFRKDVYGWDSKLGEALGVGALSFQPADRTKALDVGP